MTEIVTDMWRLQAEEKPRVWRMFLLIFFLMATYLMLKPVQSALFLVNFGPERLPYIYMLIAIIVGVFTIAYNRVTSLISVNKIIIASYILWIVLLLFFWWSIRNHAQGIAYFFYIWVSIFGVLTASQFWLTANFLFDAREAKRIFGILGTGGTLGGITGSLLTKFLVEHLHMENLLLICAGFISLCAALFISVWGIKPPDAAPKRARRDAMRRTSGAFKEILNSRYLLMLTALIGIGMITSTIVDIQFKTVAFDYYQDKNNLTGFFGMFFFLLSIFSLIAQAFFSAFFVRRTGLSGSLALLPVLMVSGTALFIIFPVLLPVILLRMADGGLRNTLNRSAIELTFLPVPADIKNKVKVFIDMFIDRLARGIGGLIILLSISIFELDIRNTGFIVLILSAIVLLIIFRFHREYVNMFRQAMEREKLDPVEMKSVIRDPATIKIMLKNLESSGERQVLYLLPFLESVDPGISYPFILRLLGHGSAEIRRRALRFLIENDMGSYAGEAEALFADDDVACVGEAVHYYCLRGPGTIGEKLNRLLESANPRIIGAVARFIGTRGQENPETLKADSIVEMLLTLSREGNPDAKIEAIRALPFAKSRSLHKQLSRLFYEKDPAVLRQVILSAGDLKKREHIPLLVDFLARRDTRPHAMKSLTAYGNKIVGVLGNHIVNSDFDFIIRKKMVKILRDIETLYSLDGLIFSLETEEIPIRIDILRALNVLKGKRLPFGHMESELREVFRSEIRYYNTIAVIWMRIGFPAEPDPTLLGQAILHDAGTAFERLFAVLELLYPQDDIINAYSGVTSENKGLRAQAIEFLEHELLPEHSQALIPIIETPRLEDLAVNYRGWLCAEINDRITAIRYLLDINNPFVHIYALHYIAHLGLRDLAPEVKELSGSSDTAIRETAISTLSYLE